MNGNQLLADVAERLG